MNMLVPAVGDAHSRGEADDRPLLSRTHAGDRRSDDAKDALQIDVECVVPLCVVEAGERDAVSDAGIGDDHVDAAMGLLGRRNDSVGGLGRPDVELVKLGLAALTQDLIGDRGALFLDDVCRDHRITCPGERLARRAPDADAGSSNQYGLAHSITSPEFGPMVWPTNRLASSEQRKATAAATSSGSPNRPSGNSAPSVRRQSSDSARTSGVLIGPGATALTRTPSPLPSRASDFVRPMIADFAAL